MIYRKQTPGVFIVPNRENLIYGTNNKIKISAMILLTFFSTCGALFAWAQADGSPEQVQPEPALEQPKDEFKDQWTTVIFISKPPGAKVQVDGTAVGITPTTAKLERGRKFIVDMEREGYDKWSASIFTQGNQLKLLAELVGIKNEKPDSERNDWYFALNFNLGLGAGLSLAEKSEGELDLLPVIFAVEGGPGLSFGKHIEIRSNFAFRLLVIIHSFQTAVEGVLYPWGAEGWFFKTGAGYFYQNFCFDCDGHPRITRGLIIPFGIGKCWSKHLCFDFTYTPHMINSVNKSGGSYAPHVAVLKIYLFFDLIKWGLPSIR